MASEVRPSRIALILPAGSRSRVAAATAVAVLLVREVGRTEVDVLWLPSVATGRAGERAVRVLLFVAANVRASVRERITPAALERVVRAYVERAYARQGIAPLGYDLQVL